MSHNSDIAGLLLINGAHATSDSLITAAFRGDIDRIGLLLSAGVDINTPDSRGVPAIVAAARSGQFEMVVSLISLGAIVNNTDTDGISALTWAKASGCMLAVDAIVQAGGVEYSEIVTDEETELDETLASSLQGQKRQTTTKPYLAHALRHKTLSGHLVRSKSEVIVADALHYRGITFDYEAPFFGKDRKAFRLPDFTIRLPSGTIVLWEHLGMLDDESYKRSWNKKELWYAMNGLDLANLYVSRESNANGIDSHEVAAVADAILARYRGD